MTNTTQNTNARVITQDPFVNATMLPFEKVCDYPSIKGMENVIISNGKAVNVVSDGYGFVSNQDFFGKFEQLLKAEHINFKTEYRNVNDTQFAADYILDGELLIPVGAKTRSKDELKPKIRLQNSYDGKIKLAGYMGFLREVCTNKLHMVKDELAFSIRRTKNNVEIVFPSMRQMLEDYKKNEMVTLHRTFEVLAERTIGQGELKDVLKTITDKTGLFMFEKSDKNPEPSLNGQFVLDTIGKETSLLDVKPNAWIVYNALNEWLYSDARNVKDEGKRREQDVKLFDTITTMFN